MSFQANCPACAAPVVFDITTSIAAVCGSCGTVVGRGDGALENYGKVADLVQTDSPLQLGLRGKYKGVPFEITGRSQLKHSAGGVWDEWYVAFREGKRWGWLAEAQGRLYLTFEKDVPHNVSLPALEDLTVDEPVSIPAVGQLNVAELGSAMAISAAGELPFAFVPNAESTYADLSGAGRKFATIDYSETPPKLYAGGEVTFEQLGIADRVRDREKELRQTAAVQVSCPNCGGSLELQAPDQTMRVTCPYCASMLAADQGNLKFLEALGKQKVKPLIPLGTTGKFTGEMIGESWPEPLEFRIIGFLQRKVRYDGTNYYWHEYLLYRPRTPFHWLIMSDGHWNFGRPLPPGAVEAGGLSASYDGKSFRLYDKSKPRVSYVQGEFYWEVSVGEETRSADYIRPPHMLSREVALLPQQKQKRNQKSKHLSGRSHEAAEPIFNVPGDGSGPSFLQAVGSTLDMLRSALTTEQDNQPGTEVNYTLSTYLPVQYVREAFAVERLPEPKYIAPNQPYPHKRMYLAGAGVLAAAMLVVMLIYSSASRRQVFQESFPMRAGQSEKFTPAKQVQLSGWKNLQVQVSSSRWVYVSGDLYNEASGKVHSFGVPAGETVYLSSVPAGTYSLTFTGESQPLPSSGRLRPAGAPVVPVANQPPQNFSVRIRQGVPRLAHVMVLLIALAAVPVLVGLHHLSFESRRWQNSDYSPFNSED